MVANDYLEESLVNYEIDFYLEGCLDAVLEVFSLIKKGLLLTVNDSTLVNLEVSPSSAHDFIVLIF